MPLKKCADKALRQNIKRREHNLRQRLQLKAALKSYIKSLTNTKVAQDELKKVYKMLDSAASKRLIHKNKASRLKSRLARRLAPKK